MYYLVIYLICLILLLNGTQQQQRRNLQIKLTENLIAVYTFHNSAEDIFGNNDAQSYQVTSTTNRHGEENKAYRCDNNQSRVVFPSTIINGLKDFSIIMWIKSDNPQSSQNITILDGTQTGTNDLLLTLSQFYFNGISTEIPNLKNLMVANKWHHLAYAFSEFYISIFLDGKIVDQSQKASYTGDVGIGGFMLCQEQQYLGVPFQSQTTFFKGVISDLRFYNQRVTPDIVKQLYLDEKDLCYFGCQKCIEGNKCISCKGNRILINDQCLCPSSYYESYQTNCIFGNDINQSNLMGHIPLNTFNPKNLVNNREATVYGCTWQPDRFDNELSSYLLQNTNDWINLESGDMFHITYVINSNSYQVYLNGGLVEQDSKTDYNFAVHPRGVVVGQDQDTINGGFQIEDMFIGYVSDIKFYSTALNEENIWLQYYHSQYECSIACIVCEKFSKKCLQCKGGRELDEGTCLCPQNYHEDIETNNCVQNQSLLDSGLQSHFPMQNNCTDVINSNDCQQYSMTATTNRQGLENGAYSFSSGMASYIKIPGQPYSEKSLFTFSFWSKYRNRYESDSLQQTYFTVNNPGQDNTILFMNKQLFLFSKVAISYVEFEKFIRTQYYDQWVFISLTISENQAKLYFNGKLYASSSIQQKPIPIPDNGFYIGQDQNCVGGCFMMNQNWKGDMSDFRIYNQPLSDKEILNLYKIEKYPCPSSCSYCKLQNTDCAFCKGNRQINNGQCICPIGKFEDFNSYDCPNCNYKCASCESNENNCLSCKDNSNRLDIPDCNCKDHYFDDGTYICKICDYMCLNCKESKNFCTECQGNNRSLAHPTCECNTGYYDDGSNQDCVQCDYKYSTCENLTGNALECSDSNRTKDNDIVCDCNQGWFDQGSQNKVCGQCHPKCLDCSGSSNNCNTCKGLQRNTSTCLCAHGYFDDDTNSDCQQCDPQCNGCIGSSNNCIECKDIKKDKNATNKCKICLGDKTLDSNNNCVCAVTGEFELVGNDNCQICNYKCETCTNNAENCQTCSDSNRQKSNNIICDCDQGWYDQGNQNKVCGKCHPRCLNCSETLVKCGTCKGLQRNIFTCSCAHGYFDDNTNSDCQQCDPQCDGCIGSSDNCIECKDTKKDKNATSKCTICLGDKTLDSNNNCVCAVTGEFELVGNDNCQICNYKCETCTNNAENCQTCSDSNRQKSNNNNLLCDCDQGWYDQGNQNKVCGKCHPRCLDCQLNQFDCAVCQSEFRNQLTSYTQIHR